MVKKRKGLFYFFKKLKRKIFLIIKRFFRKIREKTKFLKLKPQLQRIWFLFLIIGFFLGFLAAIILPRVFATESVSITKTSDSDFNEGTFVDTIVDGSGDEANLILEGPSYPSSGTWTSPLGDNVIDLVFNGGWGTGLDSSVAFQAYVEDVDSDHSIKFEMRVAPTLGGLETAEWQELGEITSGNYFSKTRADLLALGLEEGTNRYVQVRVTLNSSDGISTPVLNEFSIFYLKDNDPPEEPVLISALNEEGGEIELVSGGWYNYPHPYFEFQATDNCNPSPGCGEGVLPCCSGIAGYWVYFGTDSDADPELEGIQTTNNYYVADNLVSGEIYYLRIKSYDLNGNTSDTFSLFTYQYDNSPPLPPGYILTPPGFLQTKHFTFTWPVPPSSDAGFDDHSGLEGYQYKINDCKWYGLNHTEIENDINDFIPAEIGGYETQEEYDYDCLKEGTNYIYIRSRDSAGNFSTETVQGFVRINTQAPAAPRNLKVTPSSSDRNSFSFSWDEPLNPPAPIAEYHYSINSLPTETNHYTTKNRYLNAGPFATLKGQNTFYVVAVAEGGAVNYENYASVNFYCNAPAPGIPKNLDIFDASIRETKSYKIGLTWDSPDNQGEGFSGYKIYRSTKPNASCQNNFSDFQEIATTTTTAYIDSNLESKRYYYCVVAFNNTNQQSSPSDTVYLTPTGRWKTPPNLTDGPRAISGVRSARISWLTDRGSTSFVRIGTRSGVYMGEFGSLEKVISHNVTISGLNPATTYFYRVIWVDDDGNQGISDEYSFTTKPAPRIFDTKVVDVSLDFAYLQFTVENSIQAKIYYGKNTSYGGVLIVPTSTQKSTYTIKFSNLDDDTLYYYMIELYDSDGNKYQFEEHTFKTLPRPKVFNIEIQQIFDRPSPTLEITYKSNTDISSVVKYYPQNSLADQKEFVDLKLKREHKVEIGGLKDNTIYILEISGYDKFGNRAISEIKQFTTATDTRPPKIFDISLKTSIKGQGDKAEAQIVVSWKTDEPSTSQVGFGTAEGSYSNYTIEDERKVTDHNVLISGLKTSSIYHLIVISSDNAGNKSVSEDKAILTPKATESVLDLIFKSLKEIFGFE